MSPFHSCRPPSGVLSRIATVALALGLGVTGISAQTTITPGNTALLAGWDFDNILSTSLPASPVRPRYSDVFGDTNASAGIAAAGGIYFNGSFGSDNWGTVSKNSTGDINRDILTRSGSGSTFDLGGQTGQEGAAQFNNTNVGVTFDEFSILVHLADATNVFDDLSLSFWARDVGNTTAGATIEWSYSIDGGTTKVPTGLSNVITGNVFANYTVDLASITALERQADVYLIGRVVESQTTVNVNLDNIGAYAVAGTPSGSPPVLTSSLTTAGLVGASFTYTITADNAPDSFGATGLPTWASLNATTGAITGTPDAAAVTNVSITATNGSGTDTETLVITIDLPDVAPSITTPPGDASQVVGGNVTFTVAAAGTPAPTIQWQRSTDGGTIFADLADDATFSGVSTNTLTITGVTLAMDGDRFLAMATNGVDPAATSSAATLTVNPPAPVIDSATTASGQVGSLFSYTITATNSPTSFGATGLPSWATFNTTTGAISGTPDAAAVTTVDISATNAGGTGNGQVEITITTASVPVAPPPPTGAPTAYNAITTSWSAVGGATTYRLDVATDAAFTNFVTGYQDRDVGNVTAFDISDLPLGTYYVRVRAENGSGVSASSAVTTYAVGSRLFNLSTRGLTSTADPMIAGFYVSQAAKTVLIRASGAALANLGVSGTVPNPRLRLVRQSDNADISTNDDWEAADPAVIGALAQAAPGLVFDAGSVDSVIVAPDLPTGGYTAIVETVTGVSGIVLFELYEIDETGRLINISTRGITVESGANVMIPGTFFGPTSKKLLVRVVSDTLGDFLPPAAVLTDPILEIYDQDNAATPILTNDDWDTGNAEMIALWTAGSPTQVAGLSFPVTGSLDAAMLVVLPKNTQGYTVIAKGKNGATGNVLVEIYEVP